MGWLEFLAAFAVFFAAHNIPTRPDIKTRLVARLGQRGFGLCYSGLSLLALYWLLIAAGRAPLAQLWHWAPWHNLVPIAVMALVILILALSLGRPNPFSFGGANTAAFDPKRAGVVRWTRHPVLAALFLWASAHLVANGTLAHVIVFGIFAVFALLGTRLIDRRKRRELADWTTLQIAMKSAPWVYRPPSWRGFFLRLGIAALCYVTLLWAHGALFGVSPLV